MHLLRKIHVLASFNFAAVMVVDNSWGLSVYIWLLEIRHEGICVGHWFNRSKICLYQVYIGNNLLIVE